MLWCTDARYYTAEWVDSFRMRPNSRRLRWETWILRFTPAEPARADDRGSKHILHTLLVSDEDFTLPQRTMIFGLVIQTKLLRCEGKASPDY
jgi:hypothetical protein